MENYKEVVNEMAKWVLGHMLNQGFADAREVEYYWVDHYVDTLDLVYGDEENHLIALTNRLNTLKSTGVVLKVTQEDEGEYYIIEEL